MGDFIKIDNDFIKIDNDFITLQPFNLGTFSKLNAQATTLTIVSSEMVGNILFLGLNNGYVNSYHVNQYGFVTLIDSKSTGGTSLIKSVKKIGNILYAGASNYGIASFSVDSFGNLTKLTEFTGLTSVEDIVDVGNNIMCVSLGGSGLVSFSYDSNGVLSLLDSYDDIPNGNYKNMYFDSIFVHVIETATDKAYAFKINNLGGFTLENQINSVGGSTGYDIDGISRNRLLFVVDAGFGLRSFYTSKDGVSTVVDTKKDGNYGGYGVSAYDFGNGINILVGGYSYETYHYKSDYSGNLTYMGGYTFSSTTPSSSANKIVNNQKNLFVVMNSVSSTYITTIGYS